MHKDKRTVRGFQEWQPTFGAIPYPYSNQSRCHKALRDIPKSMHNSIVAAVIALLPLSLHCCHHHCIVATVIALLPLSLHCCCHHCIVATVIALLPPSL